MRYECIDCGLKFERKINKKNKEHCLDCRGRIIPIPPEIKAIRQIDTEFIAIELINRDIGELSIEIAVSFVNKIINELKRINE